MKDLNRVTGTVLAIYFQSFFAQDSGRLDVLAKFRKVIEETNVIYIWIFDARTNRLQPGETRHLFSPRQVWRFPSGHPKVEIQSIFHTVFLKAHLI